MEARSRLSQTSSAGELGTVQVQIGTERRSATEICELVFDFVSVGVCAK